VKRLALFALLLASSSLVAAPAPVPKPQRKPDRPAAQQPILYVDVIEEVVVPNFNVVGVAIGAIQPARQAPTQPPNADPPG
jgi:hypothetical protein